MKKREKTLFNPKGAGRPKLALKKHRWIPRTKRAEIPKGKPVHVTVKLKKDCITSLRTKKIFSLFRRAIALSRRKGLGIVHYSIQKDHIHLLIEAKDKLILAKGMQSFSISLAQSLKHLTATTKRGIFRDRYHVHILRSLSEVKNAIHYIANNGHKHKATSHKIDGYSSSVLLPNYKNLLSPSLGHFYQRIKELCDPPRFYLTGLVV